MLIDATHTEETRVAIINENNQLEELDFEISARRTLKGNVYLAKIIRVEPSLQAAFVDYGGNRHGFLAFNEIHPDYFRIPIADRTKLMEEVAEPERVEETTAESETTSLDAPTEEIADASHIEQIEDTFEDVTSLNSEGYEGDADDERVRLALHKRYKIQEVIQRGQIILIQVVKEERGSKGAALTTYLSLAGRYCVLMPNALRGGGVSRKITNVEDRKRLKSILEEAELPDGIRAIIRTAGMQRTKIEVRRDLNYLVTAWDEIRDLTLKSMAPTLVYEEASLIKRAIRDLYARDVEELIVEGKDGYKIAKDFMKSIMPSHAKNVQQYKDDQPASLFQHYGVEDQIADMHSPLVRLKSGGSIVLNPTEALVSIDVNSGKATRERHIEETAYQTNLEAAEEIARQLRLRDLAGLVVIDFIDMDDSKNNAAVERRLKECMKADRARIQLGRISTFGLLELSRQRLRPSIVESSTTTCRHCLGSGFVRSTESTALYVLRSIEKLGTQDNAKNLKVFAPTAVVLYLFNHKRPQLGHLEQRLNITVSMEHDGTLGDADFRIANEEGLVLMEKILTKIDLSARDETPRGDKSTQRRGREESSESKQKDGRKRRRGDRNDRPKDTESVTQESTVAVPVATEERPAATPEIPGNSSDGIEGAENPNQSERRRRNRGRNRYRKGGRRRGGADGAAAASEPPSEPAPGGAPATIPVVNHVPSSRPVAAAETGTDPKKGWWKQLFD